MLGPRGASMAFDFLHTWERNAARVAEVAGVLVRYGLADWLKDVPLPPLRRRLRSFEGDRIPDLPAGARLRLALTELGTTFIKLGQMLSTRPDLVGHEVAEELTQLQSGTPPAPPEVVRELIAKELGAPPERIFLEFEAAAFAAASIAQVHRARVVSGRRVVVKVMRPGTEEQVARDLEILAWLADLAEKHAPALRPYQPAATARQFSRTLRRELDFRHERQHLAVFAAGFAGDDTVRFPAPFPEHCTRRVLTMEELEGVAGADAEGLRAAGADLREFARRGALMYLRMIFRDGFYHADPHPGNLMLLPGAVVGVLDCGMIGRLDEQLRGDFEAMLLAAADRDAASLADIVLRLGQVPPDCHEDELRADLDELVGDFVGVTLTDFDVGGALRALVDIIRRHHILLPPSLSLLLKVLVMLEGTSRRLDRDFSLAELMQPFYAEAVKRRLAPTTLARRARRSVREWERLLGALPRDLGDVLSRVRRGEINVRLEHHRLDRTINRVIAGLLTASLVLASSFLWAMKAPPTYRGVSIVGVLGYLTAAWLGWRTLRAIHQSGDLRNRD
ncbi:MAG: ABC1 kinase family protein [Limisphaerales bacterium]